MNRTHRLIVLIAVGGVSALATLAAGDAPPAKVPAAVDALAEPRLRAQLLHKTIHGALQVMHRDFFRDGGGRLPIPSASLEDVFADLADTEGVQVRWLGVNAKVMNPKHRPKTPFEELAAKAIGEGLESYESAAPDEGPAGTFRYAGQITLGNTCLKCHVPDRTTLEDRKAAVVIALPLRLPPPSPPAK